MLSQAMESNKLDVSGLKAGVYLLRVIDEKANKSVMTKLVKR
jgi:hypothetical protein